MNRSAIRAYTCAKDTVFKALRQFAISTVKLSFNRFMDDIAEPHQTARTGESNGSYVIER